MAIGGITYDYSDGDIVFEAYVTGGVEGRRRPTILLAHEWSGLNASMRAVADRIAGLGYVCFALDVYGKGRRGDEQGDNHHLMGPLMADRALLGRHLLAGLQAALDHPRVDPTRVAALGYCFGGLCVLDLARTGTDHVKGVVSMHGGLGPPDVDPPAPISASILVLHGWEDPVAPVADVLALTRELTVAGADWQLHAYGHAMHAFTAKGLHVPERGLAYDQRADERAWRAMRDFFSDVIGAPDAEAIPES